jgi:hypothetical protein
MSREQCCTHKNLKVLIGTNRYSVSNHVFTFLLWFRSLKVIHVHGYQIFTFKILVLNGKRKCKVVLVHAKQVYKESRGMTPLILSLDTRWSSVVQLRWPLNKKLRGLQRRTGRFGKETELLPLPKIENWLVYYHKPKTLFRLPAAKYILKKLASAHISRCLVC